MRKKQIALTGFILFVLFFVSGCGKKIDGTYNMYGFDQFYSGEDEILLELSIEGEDATMSLNYYTYENSGFLGLSVDKVTDKLVFSGKVDPSKKTITFSDLNNGADVEMPYKTEKNTLIFKDENFEEQLKFYPEDSEEFKNNINKFEELAR